MTTVLIAALLVGAVLLYLAPKQECPQCTHCLHARLEHQERQKALRHDAEHRGFGFRDNSPDLFNCDDPVCPRNRQRS